MIFSNKNIYIFRHYWNKNGSATIEPSWITDNDKKLSLTQRKIKAISKKLLDPSKYAQLSQTMVKEEKIEDYYIYYCYHKKPDPDSTNKRTATDITFYISHKEIRSNTCDLEVPKDYVFKKSKVLSMVFSLIFLTSLLLMGFYFIDKRVLNDLDVQRSSQEIFQEHHYDILVDQWNEAVINSELNDTFLLSREDNRAVIERLNLLLEPFYVENREVKIFSKYKEDRDTFYVPIQKYLSFVDQNRRASPIIFNSDMSEDQIIELLKRVTHSSYIDNDMILKIAYMNMFELFYERKLELFYKSGFTKKNMMYKKYDLYLRRE